MVFYYKMSQMVLALIHLLLTSGNICQEHEVGFNLLLAVYGGFVFSLLSLFPWSKRENEKELQSVGNTSFPKKRNFWSRVVSTPCPFDFGSKNDVKHVRENWKGDKKYLGSGSMLVWTICICMGISNANSNSGIHPTSCCPLWLKYFSMK